MAIVPRSPPTVPQLRQVWNAMLGRIWWLSWICRLFQVQNVRKIQSQEEGGANFVVAIKHCTLAQHVVKYFACLHRTISLFLDQIPQENFRTMAFFVGNWSTAIKARRHWKANQSLIFANKRFWHWKQITFALYLSLFLEGLIIVDS